MNEAHHRAVENVESAIAAAGQRGAAEVAEALKQTVRRLRQTSTESEALSLPVSSTGAYANKAAVFLFEGERARLLTARGIEVEQLAIDLKQAAAFFSVVETKDPVVAAASEAELSPECFALAISGYAPGERAYLFPVVVKGSVMGVLFAIGNVLSPAFELLAETTASHIENLRAGDDVTRLTPTIATKKAEQWADLPPMLQAVHLRAQRMARLKVSEIRLYHTDAVRIGQQRSDLYGALKAEIETASSAYRKEFPGITDYLYLELLRNLANNEDRLLGADFPGPIV